MEEYTMKKMTKKILAGVLAGVLALSLCGCADNGYIMKVDGMDIRNGVYLYYQQDAYATANDKLNEIYNASSSSGSSSSSSSSSSSAASSSSMDFFTQSIENKSSSDWVKNETLRLIKQFVGVQRMAAEKGVTLDDDDRNEINDVIKEMWDTENYLYQIYYGFNTLGEYYEQRGISRDTMKLLYEVNSLKSKLFMQMYGKDGEKAVADKDIVDYIKETYASAQIISIPYNDKNGNVSTDTDRIDELKAKAQSYADELNGGKSFVDVQYECELYFKKEMAEANATDEYNKSPVEGKTLEEYVKEKVDEVEVEKLEDEDTYSVFQKENDSSSIDESLLSYITTSTVYDKAVTFPSTDDACVYVVVLKDISKNTHWQEDNNEAVLSEMKGEEFDSYLDTYAQNYSIEKNAYLVDTKYSPEKLFKQG